MNLHAPAWRRLPIHLINGLGVTLGLTLVLLIVHGLAWLLDHFGAGGGGGPLAALSATGGAIYASLADTPLAPRRTTRRVLTATLIGTASGALVMALSPWPLAVGLATVLIATASAMLLAWGPRAGPISFVGVLALVFSLASPPVSGLASWSLHCVWTLAGGLLYLGWSVLASRCLQPRLRTLALASALDALADLLRSRSALWQPDEDLRHAAGDTPLAHWIGHQAVLDERLQAARDLLFPAAQQGIAERQTLALLQAIDLRDTLLTSELDWPWLGHSAPAQALRRALGATIEGMAVQLGELAQGLRDARPAAPIPGPDPAEADPALAIWVASLRQSGHNPLLLNALLARARRLDNDMRALRRALQGSQVGAAAGSRPDRPLAPAELQRFVSPEGWPWASLKAQCHLRSPVLRHALRSGIALGCAYFLALALPWASHPHWLVLSVAVVLRGNLEQTLARRDARIAGTAIGCLLVLALAQARNPALLNAAFLLAAGTAHAFVTRRYLVTAVAATVMALLQAHLAQPAAGLGIAERLADTVLGALLAWGFSYVLPWWERRSLDRLVTRVQSALAALAVETLRWPEAEASDLGLRLARREAYEALGAIAGAAQRTGAEPASVRVPLYALATLLQHGHLLLAQLALLRRLLLNRWAELDPLPARAALDGAATALREGLRLPSPAGPPAAPVAELADEPTPMMGWLERRLRLAVDAGQQLGAAGQALLASGGHPEPAARR